MYAIAFFLCIFLESEYSIVIFFWEKCKIYPLSFTKFISVFGLHSI